MTYNFKPDYELLFFLLAFVAGAIADALTVAPDMWGNPEWLLATLVSSALRGTIGGLVALIGRMKAAHPTLGT